MRWGISRHIAQIAIRIVNFRVIITGLIPVMVEIGCLTALNGQGLNSRRDWQRFTALARYIGRMRLNHIHVAILSHFPVQMIYLILQTIAAHILAHPVVFPMSLDFRLLWFGIYAVYMTIMGILISLFMSSSILSMTFQAVSAMVTKTRHFVMDIGLGNPTISAIGTAAQRAISVATSRPVLG